MSRTETDGTLSSPESSPARPDSLSDKESAAPQAESGPHNTPASSSPPSAEPKQEMVLSESTLHWMVDPDKEMDPAEPDPSRQSHYDFHAPAAARRRLLTLVGAAGLVALIIALVLHVQASHRPPPVDESVASAAQISHRAELAYAQGRSGEAIELAHLAIAANPRVAGPYAVVGAVARAAGRTVEAREAYTKYIQLAPAGPRAAEARAALADLPP